MKKSAAQPRLSAKQFLQLHPEKYVMVTREFGSPIYISEATTDGLFDVGVTDNEAEATEWSAMDYTPTKLQWHIAKTGYKGLVFEQKKAA